MLALYFMVLACRWDRSTTDNFYSVDNNVQLEQTMMAKNECDILQKEEQQMRKNSSICLTTFDTIVCWTAVPASSTIDKPCPSYFNGFKVNGIVRKFCNSAGTWSKTDYSGCVPPHMWAYMANNSTMTQIELVEKLGHSGYALSVISLVVAIAIMLRYKKLHCPRNTIHINLFISFLLRGCFHFVRLPYPLEDLVIPLCRFFVVMENFLIEASYTWVFIEALYLHNTIFIHVLSERKSWLWMYVGLGWGMPLVVMSVWIGTRYVFEGSECWIIDHMNISRWILIVYPTITILMNVVFFVNITREIFLKLRHGPRTERHRYRKLTKSTFILVLVFGLYHLVFIPVEMNSKEDNSNAFVLLRIVQLYYTHFFVTFQGFIVAFLFCFFNGEVVKELRRHCCHSSNQYVSRTGLYENRHSRNVLPTERNRFNMEEMHTSQQLLSTNHLIEKHGPPSFTSSDIDSP